MIAVDIDVRDKATPALTDILSKTQSPALFAQMGRSAANLVQAHLFRLNAERANSLGGKRTNFYAQAAKSVHSEAISGGAKIGINQVGIRQRLEGGTIRPVNAKYLTIPAIAEAYGKRAREFSNLHVIYSKAGAPIGLAEAPATNVKRTKKGFKAAGESQERVFYWLVKSVTQKGDRGVLPTNGQIAAAAVEAAGNYILRGGRSA